MLPLLADQLDRARRALPAEVFEYYAAGAGEQLTLAEASQAWSRFRLRPRPLRDVSTVDLGVELLNTSLAAPIGVAPMAFQRLAHADGEIATAHGCAATGTLFIVSTRSSTRLEDIPAASPVPWWFQVYVMHDREVTARIVERAAAAGARALVLTGDTPYVGRKQAVADVRIPLPDDHFLVNIRQHLTNDTDPRAGTAQDPSIGLETIEWLTRLSGLPVLVKGVLRGDSAVECVDAGAAGVIVSNHGGRQLDRAIPAALALAEVADAVGDRVPVVVDGGIRSGVDLFVALALGARLALIGRPVLWALASGGAAGVEEALATLRDDLAHVMALAGTPDLPAIDRSMVTPA